MTTQSTTQPTPCTVCHSTKVEIAIRVPQVPVLCNILWPTRAEAVAVPKVDVALAFCHTCGHLFNPAFDPDLMVYTQEYENSLHFSPRFQQYAHELANDLVVRHELHGKDIIELGSGKGDFLKMLCALGHNRGVGFDKSYVPGDTEENRADQARFIQDWYSAAYADLPADLIVCRHTLEHIADPRAYVQELRQIIGDESKIALFFEVPNALFTLRDLAIWDIIYEHCSYFSQYSLDYLFADTGFRVERVWETFAGQFLCIEAVPVLETTAPAFDPRAIAQDVAVFAERYRAKTEADRQKLADLRSAGQKVVVWGSGSKGITFLNMLQSQDLISYAVDINPRKQGKFITGSGQQIVPPEFLRSYQPDAVIMMNPVYAEEIKQIVGGLGIEADFLIV